MKTTSTLNSALAAACLTLACAGQPEPALPADSGSMNVADDLRSLSDPALDRAERLFAQQCALCHGPAGRGDGPAAALLLPPPRDFGEGRFQLVSTRKTFPADEDLMRVLKRGIPGSSMPSFGWLPPEDLDLLVDYVRNLSTEAMVDYLTRDGTDEEEALEIAHRRMTPGARIDFGPAPRSDTRTLARGRAIYETTCAACHGEDGRGRREEPRWNEKGDIEWARDFTSGILKGGASYEQLAYRIESGMPGSSMPATHFEDPSARAALIAFVQSMMPDDAFERLVRRRGTLNVARTTDLPRAADDPAWERTEMLEVVLAPNSWRDDSILAATLQAVHDGKHVAIRVSWTDINRNDRPFGEFEYPDQAGVMLSDAGTPPPYGMGSPDHPVDLWYWTAFRLEEVTGALDLIGDETHLSGGTLPDGGISDSAAYVPARDAGPHASMLVAHGMGDRAEVRHGLETDARWSDEAWAIVFVRELDARSEDEIQLVAGGSAQLSLAIWNGAARDHGGQKSLSIWQELRFER